jgi:hypothetical protein
VPRVDSSSILEKSPALGELVAGDLREGRGLAVHVELERLSRDHGLGIVGKRVALGRPAEPHLEA